MISNVIDTYSSYHEHEVKVNYAHPFMIQPVTHNLDIASPLDVATLIGRGWLVDYRDFNQNIVSYFLYKIRLKNEVYASNICT